MKQYPFNLKVALAGAPVVTRHAVSVTKIRVLDSPDCGQTVGGFDGVTHETWYADGVYHIDRQKCSLDLFMSKPAKTIVYWTNFYPDGESVGYSTRKEADERAHKTRIGGKARKVVLEVAE